MHVALVNHWYGHFAAEMQEAFHYLVDPDNDCRYHHFRGLERWSPDKTSS